jgi:hypothetical protein
MTRRDWRGRFVAGPDPLVLLLRANEVRKAGLVKDRPDEIRFIDALRIEDKVSGALIPFDLWPFQEEFIHRLSEHDRVFGLKARQLGITWVVLAHLLYMGVFWGDRLFLIASQSGADAIDALHRLRILHESIPPQWRPTKIIDNTQQIAFANGSRFEAGMATRRYGRGKAAYATLADEFAFWAWPEDQLTALDSASQRLYAVTTGNGPGDLAHTIWQQATSGIGRWDPVFYPWSVHPDRDADWYRMNVTEAPEPRLATREHAASPRNAFAAPQGIYFERWSDANETDKGATHNWQTVRAVDFGRRHPACLWIQTSPAGQHIVVGEFAPAARVASAAMTTDEFVENIRRIDKELGLFAEPKITYCDPAGRAAEAQTGESQFEVFQRAGLNPVGRPSGIRDGCVKMFDLIADEAQPLLVSRSCPWTIECITGVVPDKNRPDLYDQNESSQYQHVLDALRYWAINRTGPVAYEPPEPTQGPASGMWGKVW